MNTHRNRTFALALWSLFILVTALGSFFVYTIYSRDAEAAVLAAEADSYARKGEQLASVRAALRDSASSLAGVDQILVPEDSVSSFIDSLEAIATDGGVTLSLGSISIDPLPGSSAVKQLHIKASSSGLWREVMSFVTTLESSPQAVSIDNLALTRDAGPAGKEAEAPRWTAGLDLTVLIAAH